MDYTIIILNGDLNGKGVYLNSRIPILQNTILNLELSDILKPPWLLDNNPGPFFFPFVYKNVLEGDILAFFNNGKERLPAIVKKGDKIVFNFDPQATIDFIQKEQYLAPNKLFYKFIPFQYHLVPGTIRRYIKRFSVLIQKKMSRENKLRFPSWPFDSSVETIKYAFFCCQRLLGNNDLKLFPSWPEKKKYALILSHDIDTAAGFANIDKFVALEKKYNLFSSWFVVAKLALAHRRELINLVRDGFEVGCHGYVHDNKLVSLGKEDMKDGLSKAVEILKELGVKGFRSPSLLRNRQLFEALEDLFLYDSSVPDTEAFLQIASRSGCCTVFPYAISGKLLELPITLALDSTLMALGFKPDRIYEIWKDKVGRIRKIGGIAHIVTHAESYYSGNKKMLSVYERLLKFISQSSDYWIVNPGELALWWQNG